MKIDVICPIYFINEQFQENVKSWFESIPIRRLWVGIANKQNSEKIREILFKFKPELTKIFWHFLYKTLGYCLRDLVSRVETKWFVYLHDDVKLPKSWFGRMYHVVKEKNLDVGESLKKPTKKEFYAQMWNNRAYSGAQLIRTEIAKKYWDYDDDYVYTSEDLIFQRRVLTNGGKYGKIPVLHEHQGHETERTLPRAEVLLWHAKALMKYLPYSLDVERQVRAALIARAELLIKDMDYKLIEEWKKKK